MTGRRSHNVVVLAAAIAATLITRSASGGVVGPPPAPTGLTATVVSATQVDLAWNAVPAVTHYEVERRQAGTSFALVNAPLTNSFSNITASPGTAYLYQVRAVNDAGTSPNSAPALATTTFFTDDPLIAGTHVKAIHLSELRGVINAVRALANSTAATFTNPATAGTLVHDVDVSELRAALDDARSNLGVPAISYTDSALGGIPVKAAHFQELRAGAGTTAAPPPHIVVNEVQTAGLSSSDEFIELYSTGAASVDISGWQIVYRTATAFTDTLVATIPPGTILAGAGYYLLGGAQYTGSTAPDLTFGGVNLGAAGGEVGIRDPLGTLMDSVAWGSANNGLGEGPVMSAPPTGTSIARFPNGADSNNNAVDFFIDATPTPRASNQQ